MTKLMIEKMDYELMKQIEWSARGTCCPICDGPRHGSAPHGGHAADCTLHARLATRDVCIDCIAAPVAVAVEASAPAIVHRIDVKAFNADGQLVYTLEALDPGPPGYLRFNIAHTQPEPGAHQTHLAIDILERDLL